MFWGHYHVNTVVDKICNALPPALVKAAIYIPGSPEGSWEEKARFLTNKAMQKRCLLAAALNINECHSFAKLAESYDHALIYWCSYDGPF